MKSSHQSKHSLSAPHVRVAVLRFAPTGWPVWSICMALVAGVACADELKHLDSDKEQLSYALGMTYGQQVRKQSVELNLAAFTQGLKDATAGGKTLLTEGEARAFVAALQDELKQKQLALQARKLQAENEQADKNLKEGEAFLAANQAKDGVVALDSGLQYRILKAGEGQKPNLDDLVVCHYRGTTLDGEEFDSTYVHGKPAIMPVKGVVEGWREALQLMPVGSKWQLFVPSKLAYGARGAANSFGPNSTLIFEVELLSIEDKPAGAAGKPGSAAAVTAAAK